MRTLFTGFMLLAASGCGIDETVFIPDYADAYCQRVISCAEPATLVFDGLSDQDACLSVVGPQIEAEVALCKYKGGKAKKCIKAIEAMSCPPDGKTFDEVLPLECEEVLIKCGEGDGTTGSTTPTSTSTSATGDTGA